MLEKDYIYSQDRVDELKDIITKLKIDERGYAFFLNGAWGTGKSYILEELEKDLSNEFFIIHYDAWKNDYYDEPLVAILSALVDIINENIKPHDVATQAITNISKEILTLIRDMFLQLINVLVEKKTGVNIKKCLTAIKAIFSKAKLDLEISKDFDDLSELKVITKIINLGLSKITSERKIVLVVDELDRCMPSYAIKVLERLHHIFNEKRIIQVIAVDDKQLENAVKVMFGNTDNYSEYKKKFIDFSYELPETEVNGAELWSLLSNGLNVHNNPHSITNEVGANCVEILLKGIDIRSQLNYIEKVRFIHSNYIEGNNYIANQQNNKIFLFFELLLIVSIQKYEKTTMISIISSMNYRQDQLEGEEREFYDKITQLTNGYNLGKIAELLKEYKKSLEENRSDRRNYIYNVEHYDEFIKYAKMIK